MSSSGELCVPRGKYQITGKVIGLKLCSWKGWNAFTYIMWLVFYLSAHRACCPSFPLPSPSVIILPLFPLSLPHCCPWPSIQQPAGEVASLITFVLIGAWWEAFAFPSVLMAPQLGPGWLCSYPVSCSRGTADAPCSVSENSWLLSLPCHKPACAPCHRARTLECSTSILLLRKNLMLQNHNFLSQKKPKQLCLGLSV